MKKRIVSIILVLTMVMSVNAQAFSITGLGACTIDFESGRVLYEKNADMPLCPASLTKIMTLYILYEKMAEGVISKDSIITVSANAARASQNYSGSNIPLYTGQQMTVDTAINAIVIPSACAVAVAVAEHISGSEYAFTKLMNDTATSLGMNAYFADASGLSNYNRVTPRSFAILVKNFILKYPDILNYTKKTSVSVNGRTYKSTNKFLNTNDPHYYSIVDGFKTGTSTLAGCNLISTGERNGSRVINVVMKANSNTDRYSDSRRLLDNGFEKIEYFTTNMFSTDIKAYINDNQIPCYYYSGRQPALCIIAENLNGYGFDTNYDSAESTLYISLNPNKAISPVNSYIHTSIKPLLKIYDQPWLKVILIKDGMEYRLNTVHSLNGQCCISIDELGSYFNYGWNDETRTATLKAIR